MKNVRVLDRTAHEIGARTDGINRHVFTGVSFGSEWYCRFLEVSGVSRTSRSDTSQTEEGIHARVDSGTATVSGSVVITQHRIRHTGRSPVSDT